MRLLFDLGHPAHVHLFRNLIRRVRNEGGESLVATRDKDVTVRLCEAYGITQNVLSKAYSGSTLSGINELLVRTFKLLALAVKFKPDALLGTSFSIGTVGRLTNRPSFQFEEDDASVIPLFSKVVYPTCSYIVTPDCLRHEDYGKKHLTYPGYHELAYLHPDHFTPDPEVPRSIGIDPEKPFFLLRFVSLKAHHDEKAKGIPFDAARSLVHMLSQRGRVLITSEGTLHEEFRPYQFPLPPERFHDVLAFSSMCIGDSQTVAAEAAVLGIPNIRCNTFVGRISYLEELEKTYGLTKGFVPGQTGRVVSTVRGWLDDMDSVRGQYKKNRQDLLGTCVNLTDWIWGTLNTRLSRKT